MINGDSKCVFVAANAAEAAVVVNWLEHEGVPAQVMNRMTLGGLDGPLKKSLVGVAVVLPPPFLPQFQGWQYNCHPNDLAWTTSSTGC